MNILKMSSSSNSNSTKTTTKNNLKIIRVAGSESHTPHTTIANIVNSNPSTYFSSKGIGAFADIELDEESEFNTVQIGFFRGHERKTKFTISQTNDFVTFKPVKPHTFVSSGSTQSPEKHYFQKTKAKGIRVSFEGNVDNGVDVFKPLINKNTDPANNVNLVAPLSYNPNPVGSIEDLTGVQQQIKKTSNVIGPRNDVGANAQFFSINGISLLNEELEERDQQELDHKLKEIQEHEEKETSCKECKCIRCHSECEEGVCIHCGITGNYNYGEPEYISKVFPASFINNQLPGFVNNNNHNSHSTGNNIDTTTPSKTQPPKEFQLETHPKAGLPAQSGNTEVFVDNKPNKSDTESVKNDSSFQKDTKLEKSKNIAEVQKEKDDSFTINNNNNNQNNKSRFDLVNKDKDNKDNKKVSTSKDTVENEDVITTTKTATKVK
jgi:hypothetical protein